MMTSVIELNLKIVIDTSSLSTLIGLKTFPSIFKIWIFRGMNVFKENRLQT